MTHVFFNEHTQIQIGFLSWSKTYESYMYVFDYQSSDRKTIFQT